MIRTFFRYGRVFRSYTGKLFYLLVGVMFVGGLTEGIGLTLFLPLFNELGSTEASPSRFNGFFEKLFNILGLDLTLGTVIAFIVAVVAITGVIRIVQEALNSYLNAKMLTELRLRLINGYAGIRYPEYLSLDTGQLTNIALRETERATSSFGNYAILTTSAIHLLLYFGVSFLLDWQMTLAAIIVGLALSVFVRVLSSLASKYSILISKHSSIFQQQVIQFLQAFKYLKATNSTQAVQKHIDKSTRRLSTLQFRVALAGGGLRALSEPLAVIMALLLIVVQTMFFQRSFAEIMVMVLIFYRILQKILAFQNGWQCFYSLIGSVGACISMIETLADQQENYNGAPAQALSESIELKDVSFNYGTHKVLDSVSLSIPKGAAIAFVGESGSGKSTLLDLITGLQTPTHGSICIDGVDLTLLNQRTWRSQIGYVIQEHFVFLDTLANNISLWDDLRNPETLAAIKKASDAAALSQLIARCPDGLETIVGDRGSRLSGGERQRLSLARELYKQPQLLILDEATSALDGATETRVQDQIDQLKGTMTLIVVAHRLATIKNCDYLYVLSHGRVVESGTYVQLMADPQSQLYALSQHQLTKSPEMVIQ